jgi:hypothetical protein
MRGGGSITGMIKKLCLICKMLDITNPPQYRKLQLERMIPQRTSGTIAIQGENH